MNPLSAAADVITRPRVVLGLRACWDFLVGTFLVLGVPALVAVRGDVLIIGLGTLAAGAWAFASVVRRPKKVSP